MYVVFIMIGGSLLPSICLMGNVSMCTNATPCLTTYAGSTTAFLT